MALKALKPIYVLGTATSHDGSACLLKDGKIAFAIEKERITRKKHDGGNDNLAIQYCLDAEGISLDDITLIVQNDNFSDFKYGNDYLGGERLFAVHAHSKIETISHHLAHAYSAIGTCPFDDFNLLVIDGCGSPFDQCIDNLGAVPDRNKIAAAPHLFCEKDSFYSYANGQLKTIMKDFSPYGYLHQYPNYPNSTKDSIGGLYAGVSIYCFGDHADPGKLMGLAPFGKPNVFNEKIFDLDDGRVFVNYDWIKNYQQPARNYEEFKQKFQYFADIAYGVQKEIERALLYLIEHRLALHSSENLCYAGGTALNAVANSRILKETSIENIYIEPAAGDNGLALGCAYYGWLEILKQPRIKHSGSTCFGARYNSKAVENAILNISSKLTPALVAPCIHQLFYYLNSDKYFDQLKEGLIQFNLNKVGVYQLLAKGGKITCYPQVIAEPQSSITIDGVDFYRFLENPQLAEEFLLTGQMKFSNPAGLKLLTENFDLSEIFKQLSKPKIPPSRYQKSEFIAKDVAQLLASGKIIGWFQGGCEFGPRALGRRSILADPRNKQAKSFINSRIKFREDFRPFAPSVLKEDMSIYFDIQRESPYMILVDQVRPEWQDKISSVVHADKSCRVQTVTPDWNKAYYDLITQFKQQTGMSVLLNTSLNRKGMPIVETPEDALSFFYECELDCMVIENYIVYKSVIG